MSIACEGSGSSTGGDVIGRIDTRESDQISISNSHTTNSHTNSSTNSGSNRTNTDEKEEDEDNAGAGEAYLLFEIKDMGIGIAQDVMDALFAPFKQAQRFAGGTTHTVAVLYMYVYNNLCMLYVCACV